MSMLPRSSRLLTALAALLLLGVYVLPLWRIDLDAPQYPEGIGMLIHVNTVEGLKENDLNNINGLNHYIGMKAIHAETIPELRYMPWIVAGLVVAGLGVALAGRRAGLVAWLGLFAAVGVAGLYDFWRWGYDYGHDLDPHAIIQVPGMAYQPPLIGSKQLLNFTAHSWPAAGGILVGVSLGLGVVALLLAWRRRGARPIAAAAAALAAACAAPRPMAGQAGPAAAEVQVSPAGPVRTIAEAVRRAPPGGRVVIRAGVYREPTIVIDRPLELVGEGWPTVDGEGARELVRVEADDVTISGLRLIRVGASMTEDRAAIRVREARNCRIGGNRFEETFFGVYLARVEGCRIENNVFAGPGDRATEATSGNAIHLWSARDVDIVGNRIAGHRDGIYFEFVRHGRVVGNVSDGNLRYGLHFMYADSSRYERNTFRHNGSGVAVMYASVVEMTGNDFVDNRGGAAYGLLLKEITDATLRGNRFARNTIGLMADGATRLVAEDNVFGDNGWAVRLLANVQEARLERNDFAGNSFDIATNGRGSEGAVLAGNYFDDYRGYDLDGDGRGDVPHHPVRLFAVVVEQWEQALVLQRSFFVGLLDAAERVVPALTPARLADPSPAMRPVAGTGVR